MRPAHKAISAGVLEVREWACFTLRSRSLSIRTWSFVRYRFAEANPIRSFFSFPEGEKVYLYVNKTLCWKPRFPNYQSGFAAVVWSSWNGSIGEYRGRPRHRTIERLCLRRNVFSGRSRFSNSAIQRQGSRGARLNR